MVSADILLGRNGVDICAFAISALSFSRGHERLQRERKDAQAPTEEDPRNGPEHGGDAPRLEIGPGNDLSEQIGREYASAEAKHTAHRHAGQRAQRDDQEYADPSHISNLSAVWPSAIMRFACAAVMPPDVPQASAGTA